MARKTKRDLEADIAGLKAALQLSSRRGDEYYNEILSLKRQRTSMHATINHTDGVHVGWRQAHHQLSAMLAEYICESPPRATVPQRGEYIEGPNGIQVKLPEEGIPHE